MSCRECVVKEVRTLPWASAQRRWALAYRLVFVRLVFTAMALVLSLYGLSQVGADGLLPEGLFVYEVGLLVVGVPLILATIGAAVAYLRWLHLLVRTAVALGEDVGVTPGWAVAWWFVPLANLWKPYETVRTLVRRLGGEAVAQETPVGAWWAAWAFMLIADRVESRMSRAAGEAFSQAELMASVLTSVLTVVAGLLCLRVMKRLQAAAEARVAALETAGG